MAERMTYLLVDGENIDATLGTSILGRRPRPGGAPALGPPARVGRAGLRPGRHRPVLPRRQHRDAHQLRPGAARDRLQADPAERRGQDRRHRHPAHRRGAGDREADVVLVSHDGDFVDQVSALCDGSRQVGVIGFTEFVNSQFRNLPGLRIFDLEYDIGGLQLAAAARPDHPDRRVRPARLPLRAGACRWSWSPPPAGSAGSTTSRRATAAPTCPWPTARSPDGRRTARTSPRTSRSRRRTTDRPRPRRSPRPRCRRRSGACCWCARAASPSPG